MCNAIPFKTRLVSDPEEIEVFRVIDRLCDEKPMPGKIRIFREGRKAGLRESMIVRVLLTLRASDEDPMPLVDLREPKSAEPCDLRKV